MSPREVTIIKATWNLSIFTGIRPRSYYSKQVLLLVTPFGLDRVT
jgi:hypothetical protein